MANYREYKQLNLTEVADEVRSFWKTHDTFAESIAKRSSAEPFVFFEGPPSANGMPGIHHVMARTIKDLFCRYQTQKGFKVERKAGWDTHGLPVELGVEKELGITKEDIGKNISIEEYNQACRKAVMRYTDVWNDLTDKMGYWVDMEEPYVTYKTKYIESVWWLLKQLYDKGLLYKGYTIQPYSPKAGTGLSSHELNMPGTYRDVKDNTIVAQFQVADGSTCKIDSVKKAAEEGNLHFLAWTTTPWTLPSNTALTVGPKIDYVLVKTYNQYTSEAVQVILAEALVAKQFSKKFIEANEDHPLDAYQSGDKKIPYQIIDAFKGSDLVGIHYHQLMPYAQPMHDADQAFRIIPGDFVTTEDGTGIVHTAPTFGADDAKVAKDAGVPPLLVADDHGNPVPLVDLSGKFVAQVKDEQFGFSKEHVKAEYLTGEEIEQEFAIQKDKLSNLIPNLKSYLSVDERIALKLKLENKAFKIEKYEHSYPHCWRTDRPILYYPLDSWFVRSTAMKDRMMALNNTINWKPKATGTGRFGNWLENLNDWNLSRSRYWGIPLPLWRTEEGDETKCIGSLEELIQEIEAAVEAGVMESNPYADFKVGNMDESNYEQVDLHRPYADNIVLVSSDGRPMKREADLIDVWFDSGSMPYAQWHYPFENKERVDGKKSFPADFIAEGVDQTRGWFFTLHAIGTMVFDQVAYKNVVSNGLVLDKKGQKMSKRLGNAADPFETLKEFGADATRWYMITNAQPWDNLKFDPDGIVEVQRKFFRALHNTYAFYSLYANVDGFKGQEDAIALEKRPEIDRWVLSKLNTLIKEVDAAYGSYEPTKAGRLIQEFVVDNLSNWHVRLSRKRFWRGEYGQDKIAAYQTLYTCLTAAAKLSAPLAPFYSDRLFQDLNSVTGLEKENSVHLTDFPETDENFIDVDLEERMALAQQVSSMVLSLRKRENIRVRQPLAKIMVPVLDEKFSRQLHDVENLIKTETNIKGIEYIQNTDGVFAKKIKPNFPVIGKDAELKRSMKVISGFINQMGKEQIAQLEKEGELHISNGESTISLGTEHVVISTDDIPGWLVLSEGGLTVALDIQIDEALYQEGLSREIVNRIQTLRKDSGFEVTDRIKIRISSHPKIQASVDAFRPYICAETLADELELVETLSDQSIEMELDEQVTARLEIVKV